MITTLSVLNSVSVSTSCACRVRSAARNPAISVCCASIVVCSALMPHWQSPALSLVEDAWHMIQRFKGLDLKMDFDQGTRLMDCRCS
ncbi:hypothetical protein Tco_0652095 [Tanacetum coccineum]|uniref:Uncharacterized protein n=1 Tax=Tanacetum coccineum TaxID=301880 RepID=A0ABQ4WWM1_9ASTR